MVGTLGLCGNHPDCALKERVELPLRLRDLVEFVVECEAPQAALKDR
jgi:hypothetical protein